MKPGYPLNINLKNDNLLFYLTNLILWRVGMMLAKKRLVQRQFVKRVGNAWFNKDINQMSSVWRECLWDMQKTKSIFSRLGNIMVKDSCKIFLILIFTSSLLGLMKIPASAASNPFWKVGRAKVEVQKDAPGQDILSLKLSLRNEGKPGSTPVKIMGRWGGSGQTQQGEFTQLGLYTQQVALKQTVILMISLESLGAVPQGVNSLELLVITGSDETDRQLIGLP
jgi:hypothetical protein